MTARTELPVWHDADGKVLSCKEKIRVLNEALSELADAAQDALEDALLMGVEETQIRKTLIALVSGLENPYKR
ncbi:hypothetical protein [Radicibacter daui]|uniref:hypothetical protein n=1 Tax=Radicibacter daui TaxID=3064829 RepID=UPI004046E3F6